MAQDLQLNLGSLFEFIPPSISTQATLRAQNQPKHKSHSLDYRSLHNLSLQVNPLSEMVQAKNRKIAEEKEKQMKQQMYRTKQKLRASQVSKRLTKMSGFFAENSDRQQSTTLEKETDKISKKHGLLRAIIKTRYEDSKFNQPDFYNESFNRLQKGFRQIKLREILSSQREPTQYKESQPVQRLIDLIKNNVPPPNNPQTSSMSARTRIRLQSCRSWAVRHHQHAQFYCRKLNYSYQGKSKSKDTSTQRSQILNSIKSVVK